jgi:hypothetical protein
MGFRVGQDRRRDCADIAGLDEREAFLPHRCREDAVAARATALAGAEVVAGSFEDDPSLARALDGVDAMLLAGRDNDGGGA